ncbi:T9SS type A sorting domain-containing protein, partial [bacterium]|nr:T9SS type A sorting domain-containing protein [bacterium]
LNLQREGDTLLIKANLKNISIAKIETGLKIETGDLLKERRANMLRTTEKEGETGEGILAKLKIKSSEEPITLEITCTFIDAEGNLIYIQEQITIEPQTPSVSELFQSFPNPADNGCYIPFKLSADSNVTVEVYNILGQKVRTIEAGYKKAAFYTKKEKALFWDLTNNQGQKVSDGLYFIRFSAGEFSATKALMVR